MGFWILYLKSNPSLNSHTNMKMILLLAIFLLMHFAQADNECGISPFPEDEVTGKIVGGRDALRGQWPWLVSMCYLRGRGKSCIHYCAATIVNEDWLMTAAHCLAFVRRKSILLRVNEYNLTDISGNEINRSIKEVILHPKWNMSTADNDIALIKMNASLQLNEEEKWKTICLPTSNVTFNFSRCLAIGWGLLSFGGERPQILQEIEMPLVSRNVCTENFKDINRVTENMICAGHLKGSKGVCHGDSGGPLQCQSDDGNWFQIGVTSWTQGCAWENYPGVFARVLQYSNWINDVTSLDRNNTL